VDLVTPMSGLITPDPDMATQQGTTAHPTLEPGDKFAGRYTIESIVGRGGMGVVYKALDEISGRAVALKLISTAFLGGDKAVRRLIEEGVLARDIRHPNVVAVYDVGLDGEQPFVAMEYVEGVSLRLWHGRRMQQGDAVPLRVAARIICEVLDGLKAAHDAGVVHRDLKPENIILTAEPTDKAAPLKLLDFGIARAGGSRSTASSSTRGIGTPYYMAPEQRTNPDAVTPAADLYSISVMLYELLVNVVPEGHWQPPSGGRSDVPQEVDALILKGMSNNRDLRPQSADQYRKELVAAVNRIPTPQGFDKPAGGSGVNGRTVAMVAGGAAVFVLALAGISILPRLVNGDPSRDPTDTYCDPNDPAHAIYCDDSDDKTDDDSKGGDHVLPPPPPPPPPEKKWYEYLSGRWDDGLGGYYNIQVSPNGGFSGTGRTGDGYNVGIRGTINSGQMAYVINANGADVATGQAVQQDACHFAFQTYMYGQVAATGQFHVRHQPGGPCPS